MITAQYRVVHYIPDPFVGGRYPIAALIRGEDTVRVVRAPAIPDARCLGGREHVAAIRMILGALEGANFENLPTAVGPQASLDSPRDIPTNVSPEEWITSFVLPRTEERAQRARGPKRSTLGFRFFQQEHLDRYVKKLFSPARHPGVFPELTTVPLLPISHWVHGRSQILLLEPLVTTLRTFEDDVQRVSTTFGAYKYHLADDVKDVRFLAYLLPSGDSAARQNVRMKLKNTATVIDLSDSDERSGLVREVRFVGESTTGNLPV